MERKQRATIYTGMNSEYDGPDRDSLFYQANGSRITLGIFPRLGSGLPDIPKIEIKTTSTAPEKMNFTKGGYCRIEHENEEFAVFVVGFGNGILPIERGIKDSLYQFLGIVAKPSGEVVYTVTGNGEYVGDYGANFALYAFRKWNFDRNAKALDQKSLSFRLHPIDEEKMSRNFTASAHLGGSVIFSLERPTKEIWDKKGKPDTNFSFWKRGWSWKVGDKVAFIGEDFSGLHHVGVFSLKGQTIIESHSDFLQTAIESASHFLGI